MRGWLLLHSCRRKNLSPQTTKNQLDLLRNGGEIAKGAFPPNTPYPPKNYTVLFPLSSFLFRLAGGRVHTVRTSIHRRTFRREIESINETSVRIMSCFRSPIRSLLNVPSSKCEQPPSLSILPYFCICAIINNSYSLFSQCLGALLGMRSSPSTAPSPWGPRVWSARRQTMTTTHDILTFRLTWRGSQSPV